MLRQSSQLLLQVSRREDALTFDLRFPESLIGWLLLLADLECGDLGVPRQLDRAPNLPRKRKQLTAGHSSSGESHKADNHKRRREHTTQLLISHPTGTQLLGQFPVSAEDFNVVEYRLLMQLADKMKADDGSPNVEGIYSAWGEFFAATRDPK